MICDRCHEDKDDVEYIANPYDEDVNNEIVMEYLCGNCYQEYCYDI